MRTTLKLDDDVAAAAEQLRRHEHIGISEAVNRLARAGLVASSSGDPYVHRTHPLGLQIDVANIAEVLDLLEEH